MSPSNLHTPSSSPSFLSLDKQHKLQWLSISRINTRKNWCEFSELLISHPTPPHASPTPCCLFGTLLKIGQPSKLNSSPNSLAVSRYSPILCLVSFIWTGSFFFLFIFSSTISGFLISHVFKLVRRKNTHTFQWRCATLLLDSVALKSWLTCRQPRWSKLLRDQHQTGREKSWTWYGVLLIRIYEHVHKYFIMHCIIPHMLLKF